MEVADIAAMKIAQAVKTPVDVVRPPVRPARSRRKDPPRGSLGGAAVLLAIGLLLVIPGLRNSPAGTLPILNRAKPILGDPRAPLLLVWTSGTIPAGLAATARQINGVGAVAEVSNGLGWISSWSDAGGRASSAPAGYQIPLEIMAIDPQQYAAFVPTASRALFESLSDGGALLGRTGASLRGIKGEGTLVFAGSRVPVRGVVEDKVVATHEAVVSRATGRALGIDEPKYLILSLKPGADRTEVMQSLRTFVPADRKLSSRGPAEAPVFRPGGTILPQATLKKLFGEFAGRPGDGKTIRIDPQWILANTTTARIPLLGTVRCQKAIIPQMRGAFQEIADSGLGGLVRDEDFGGCFSPRLIAGDPGSGLSRHAWGTAFDFNVSRNPFGEKPTMDPRLVAILERWGFTWGGRWTTPDGMHFEYLRKPNP